jgi:hypothetical protein
MYIKHTIADKSTEKDDVDYISFSFSNTYYVDDANKEVPIMLQKLFELDIKFTPSAAQAIVYIYNNNITNDLFYLYINKSSNIYLLLTSEDIVQFEIYNKYTDFLLNPISNPISTESIILLNKFDTSDEIIVLLMLFIMKIPSNSIMDDTIFLEIFSKYKHFIVEHFKTTYKYDLNNINKRFADMMV